MTATDPRARIAEARKHLAAAVVELVGAALTASEEDADCDAWATAQSARNDALSAISRIDRLPRVEVPGGN